MHSSKTALDGSVRTVQPDAEDDDTRCGLGSCQGPLLQRFASKKMYIFFYSFLGLFQSMFFSYSIATLTTVEKEFKFNSQTTGQWLGTIYIFAYLI